MARKSNLTKEHFTALGEQTPTVAPISVLCLILRWKR